MQSPIIQIDNFAGGCTLNPQIGGGNSVYLTNNADVNETSSMLVPSNRKLPMNVSFLSYDGGTKTDSHSFGNSHVIGTFSLKSSLTGASSTDSGLLIVGSNETYGGGVAENIGIFTKDSVDVMTETATLNAGATVVNGETSAVSYDDVLYVAGGNRLHKVTGLGTGSVSPSSSFNTATTWQHLIVGLDNKIINAGSKTGSNATLSTYDGTTFQIDALNIGKEAIFGLSTYGADRVAFIGTQNLDYTLYIWDGISPKPLQAIKLTSRPLDMVDANGYLWIFTVDDIQVLPYNSLNLTTIYEFATDNGGFNQYTANNRSALLRSRIVFPMGTAGLFSGSDRLPAYPPGVYSTPASPENFTISRVQSHDFDVASVDVPVGLASVHSSDFGLQYYYSHVGGYSASTSELKVYLVDTAFGNATAATSFNRNPVYGFVTAIYEPPIGGVIEMEGIGMRVVKNSVISNMEVYFREDEDCEKSAEFPNWTLMGSMTEYSDFLSYHKTTKKIQFKVEVTTTPSADNDYSGIKNFYVTGNVIAEER